MSFYTFYWRDGTKSILQGTSAESAFSASYSAGAINAVDLYSNGVDHGHYWDPHKHEWISKAEIRLEISAWNGMSDEEKLTILKTAETLDIEDNDGWHFRVSFTTYVDEDLGYYYVGNFSYYHSNPESSGRELKSGVVGRLYVDPDHLDPLVHIVNDFIVLKSVSFQTLDEILAEKVLQ